jgi:hypothetical protein
MFKEIAPDLNFDYATIDEEEKSNKDKLHFLTIKDKTLFDHGNYKVPRLIAMAFLYCFHFNH